MLVLAPVWRYPCRLLAPTVERASPFLSLRSLGGGCWVEAPTHLSAAWEEAGGAQFEHIRFTLTALDAV